MSGSPAENPQRPAPVATQAAVSTSDVRRGARSASSAQTGPSSEPAVKPLVCVIASRQMAESGRHRIHSTGERNVDAVERFSGCLPLVLPALGDRLDIADLVRRIDGLLLTGGRANVQPHHYGGPPFPDDEPIDPDRDATVLPLVRACLDAGVPMFGICRGIQEMNVALGGSLHYRLHLLPDTNDHRMPRHENVTVEEIFALRHELRLTPGGLFERLAGTDRVVSNTLHGQGIDRLADDFMVEAITEDAVVEGIRLKDDRCFAVGVQWHAEYQPECHPLSRSLFEAFGDAARERARQRGAALRSVATR
ncbi:MAG: gamma-glutamyl-gamma-aminobutyrate hydrolase family protein [Gammaproteobacteria bacterium]|nr:gamma-glutamyl-gamma-aminobutyrate hydrolase family protein [Gammaproteobacteria bacterium]